ncbi:MAG: hypothetical protein ABF533_01010, partial [Acetobacter persici]
HRAFTVTFRFRVQWNRSSVDKMLGYKGDQTKDGTVSFDRADISSFALNVGVPYITDPTTMDDQTRAEWKALCRAYHDAQTEMATENEIFTFNINPVI